MSPRSVYLLKRGLWSRSNCQDLIFLPKDNFFQTACLMILAFRHQFFSKPEKNYFGQKNPKSHKYKHLFHSFTYYPFSFKSSLPFAFCVCSYHVFPLFFLFFPLLSLFHSTCPNGIYFVLILHFFFVLTAVPSAEGILFSVFFPIQLPSSFQFLIPLLSTRLCLFTLPHMFFECLYVC